MESEDLKKIIESCHLNFLIGSGASSPYFKILGDIENQITLLAARANSISQDEYQVIEASMKQYYFESCIEGNLEIMKGGKGSLDQVLSNYDAFLSSLNTILVKRRSNLVSKQVNLFTTNMDLFFDWSLEQKNLSYNDGFAGRLRTKYGTVNFHNTVRKTSSHFDYHAEVPHFNLFKLHGSVNWKLGPNNILYDYNLNCLNELKLVKLPKTQLINSPTDSVDVIIKSIKKTPIPKSNAHEKFLAAYDKLVMINPTKAKFETTTRDLTFYELLRMYSNHLERENSVLFVIGFSFSDEHIREITKRVVASNPTLLTVIFAHTKKARIAIQENLGDRPNIKYICDESGSIEYSLDKINEGFFLKLADGLN